MLRGKNQRKSKCQSNWRTLENAYPTPSTLGEDSLNSVTRSPSPPLQREQIEMDLLGLDDTPTEPHGASETTSLINNNHRFTTLATIPEYDHIPEPVRVNPSSRQYVNTVPNPVTHSISGLVATVSSKKPAQNLPESVRSEVKILVILCMN